MSGINKMLMHMKKLNWALCEKYYFGDLIYSTFSYLFKNKPWKLPEQNAYGINNTKQLTKNIDLILESISSNLLEILARNKKEGFTINISRYSFESLKPGSCFSSGYAEKWGRYKNYEKRIKFGVYLDSQVGIALMFDGEPIAVTSFQLETSWFTSRAKLLVKQIQGIRPTKLDADKFGIKKGIQTRDLMPFNWAKAMAEIDITLAEEIKCAEVIIQSASNNTWFNQGGFSEKRALQTYDNTAKELEFTKQEDNNWHLNL